MNADLEREPPRKRREGWPWPARPFDPTLDASAADLELIASAREVGRLASALSTAVSRLQAAQLEVDMLGDEATLQQAAQAVAIARRQPRRQR